MKGYTLVAKEFDEALRSIVQMDYGLVMISHAQDKTFTNEQGQEYNQIVPTLGNKPRNIVTRMTDIIGYSRVVETEDGASTKLFMRGTPRYVAGSRFKHTPNYIDFTYDNLVSAICDAIDKQAQEDGSEFFTDKRSNLYVDTTSELDFDELMSTFNQTVDALMNKDGEFYKPRITQIIERYLGKGHKVNDVSRDQVEAISLIVSDLQEL